jgi:hypothetical protein
MGNWPPRYRSGFRAQNYFLIPTLHHTNQDIYDHCVPEDLVQSTVVMASFVNFAAMREKMLRRRPLPIPVEAK